MKKHFSARADGISDSMREITLTGVAKNVANFHIFRSLMSAKCSKYVQK